MAGNTNIDRREISRRAFSAAVGLCAVAPWAAQAQQGKPMHFAEVWKDPDCGCCKEWVTHLEAHSFKVKVNDTGNDTMRSKLGVADRWGSCHTALVGGYAIEGHVPAREILRLLKEKPQAVGLSVPGMPVGSPGMDSPLYGGRKDAFNVMLLAKDGSARIYQTYEGNRRS